MRRRVTLGVSLIVAGMLVLWADELREPLATGSACRGCPAVLRALVVVGPDSDPQSGEEPLACSWRTQGKTCAPCASSRIRCGSWACWRKPDADWLVLVDLDPSK